MITIGITPIVGRFTTETTTTEAVATATESTVRAAELVPVSTKGIDRQTGTPAGAAESPSVSAQPPGLLKETTRLLEDTLNPSVRAVRTRGPSAATTMAERQGALRHAEVRASVAEQRVVAAVFRIGNRRIAMFLVACKT